MTEGIELTELEAHYRRHRRVLVGIARKLVGIVDADAVVQEVFVELLRNDQLRARFTGGNLEAFLAAITRHKALEHLRSAGREIPSEEPESVAEPRGFEPALIAQVTVKQFMSEHVPARQHPFFVLRFLERRTQAETAEVLAMPRSTLEGWEHRIVQRLRRFLTARPR